MFLYTNVNKILNKKQTQHAQVTRINKNFQQWHVKYVVASQKLVSFVHNLYTTVAKQSTYSNVGVHQSVGCRQNWRAIQKSLSLERKKIKINFPKIGRRMGQKEKTEGATWFSSKTTVQIFFLSEIKRQPWDIQTRGGAEMFGLPSLDNTKKYSLYLLVLLGEKIQ